MLHARVDDDRPCGVCVHPGAASKAHSVGASRTPSRHVRHKGMGKNFAPHGACSGKDMTQSANVASLYVLKGGQVVRGARARSIAGRSGSRSGSAGRS